MNHSTNTPITPTMSKVFAEIWNEKVIESGSRRWEMEVNGSKYYKLSGKVAVVEPKGKVKVEGE